MCSSDLIKQIKNREIENILDLLISLSSTILNSNERVNPFSILEITSIKKMKIVFDFDILQYTDMDDSLLRRDVKLTSYGKLFIKNIQMHYAIRKINTDFGDFNRS